MAEAAQEGGDHVLVAEEVHPVIEIKVGRDNRRAVTIAFFHELEEDVALLGAEGEVTHLVDAEEGDAGEAVDELAGGAIGERGIQSSKRSWALMNRAREPFWSAVSKSPVARPDLATPVGPMKTMLVAVGMKSSSARLMIWRLLTPGWSLKGNVSSAQRSGSRA